MLFIGVFEVFVFQKLEAPGNSSARRMGHNDIINKAQLRGNKGVCEIHLKPKKGIHFGKNDGTDLAKLAATLDEIGYHGWLVFEQGGGVEKGKIELSKENLKGVQKLASLRKKS